MKNLLVLLTNAESSSESSTEKMTETLKNIVKSPIFYIVIGVLVLLIIAIYLLRRIIRPSPNVVKVVVRNGKIHKLIDEQSSNYYLVPLKDRLGATISLNERELVSDRLFINNGPDALYKINYSLKYKVNDVGKYFNYRDSFQNILVVKLNDNLREYSDNGHVFELIRDYRDHAKDILKVINELSKKYGVQAVEFKVNFVEPLGKK